MQETTAAELKKVENPLNEVHRRHVKLECHSRRSNMKFYGIEERGKESNSDTEEVLRKFMRDKLRIPISKEDKIHFDRVHHIATRTASANQESKPRPIIVKLTYFQDKDCITSFIKTTSQRGWTR